MGRRISLREAGRWGTAAILLLLQASCSEPADTADFEEVRLVEAPCRTATRRPQELKAEAEADQRLEELAFAGHGDPVAEARRAIEQGDVRFFGYAPAPGPNARAYGVACRGVGSQGEVLLRSVSTGSDIPGGVTEMETSRMRSDNHARFGTRYNAALLASDRNPLRDICRSSSARARGSQPNPQGIIYDGVMAPLDPRDYGFRDLEETSEPLDLGEAARKGTLESLQQVIVAHPDQLNDSDILGMTPLAWAIAYRREHHARTLLRAGANPAGAGCAGGNLGVAPIQIARQIGWGEMVQAMLAEMDRRRTSELNDPAQQRPAAPAARPTIQQLAERYRTKLKQGLTRIEAVIKVNASGASTSCTLRLGTGVPEIDAELCPFFLVTNRWAPARNAFGHRVEGEGIVRTAIVNRDP